MAEAPAHVRLLLPAASRLPQHPLLQRMLARSERLAAAPAGRHGQLQSAFGSDPRRWPAAALTRDLDCSDAGLGMWLRADPAQLLIEPATTRLVASADASLVPEDALSVLDALFRPLFGDEGMQFSAPTRSRWYLQLDDNAVVPPMALAEEARGARLDSFLPEGKAGARWRRLMNEAQMLLHAQRARVGAHVKLNSLWFWGGGRLPWAALPRIGGLLSNDPLLLGMAKAARVPGMPLADAEQLLSLGLADGSVIDLAGADPLDEPVLAALLGALSAAQVDIFLLSGERHRWRPLHRFRFWRSAAGKA